MTTNSDTEAKWQQYPVVKDVPVRDPKGKVTGVVTLAFTRATHVHVSTEAHVNDDESAVDFRGESWLPSISVNIDYATGVCTLHPDGPHVTRRQNWSAAPKSYRDAICAALVATTQTYVDEHPIVRWSGEWCDATNDVNRYDEDIAELESKISDLRAQQSAALTRKVVASRMITGPVQS